MEVAESCCEVCPVLSDSLCIHTYLHAYIHTYTHTYLHAHTHIHARMPAVHTLIHTRHIQKNMHQYLSTTSTSSNRHHSMRHQAPSPKQPHSPLRHQAGAPREPNATFFFVRPKAEFTSAEVFPSPLASRVSRMPVFVESAAMSYADGNRVPNNLFVFQAFNALRALMA